MSLSSDPLWLRFVSGPDIDELGLTPAESSPPRVTWSPRTDAARPCSSRAPTWCPTTAAAATSTCCAATCPRSASAGVSGVKVVGDFVPNYELGLPSELALLTLYDPLDRRAAGDHGRHPDHRGPDRRDDRGRRPPPRPPGREGARPRRRPRHGLLQRRHARRDVRPRRDPGDQPPPGVAGGVRRPAPRGARHPRASSPASVEETFDGADIAVEATRLTEPHLAGARRDLVQPGALLVPYGTVSAVDLDLLDVMDKVVVDDWREAQAGEFGALRPHVDTGRAHPRDAVRRDRRGRHRAAARPRARRGADPVLAPRAVDPRRRRRPADPRAGRGGRPRHHGPLPVTVASLPVGAPDDLGPAELLACARGAAPRLAPDLRGRARPAAQRGARRAARRPPGLRRDDRHGRRSPASGSTRPARASSPAGCWSRAPSAGRPWLAARRGARGGRRTAADLPVRRRRRLPGALRVAGRPARGRPGAGRARAGVTARRARSSRWRTPGASSPASASCSTTTGSARRRRAAAGRPTRRRGSAPRRASRCCRACRSRRRSSLLRAAEAAAAAAAVAAVAAAEVVLVGASRDPYLAATAPRRRRAGRRARLAARPAGRARTSPRSGCRRRCRSGWSVRCSPTWLRSIATLEDAVGRALAGVTDSPAWLADEAGGRFLGTAGFHGLDLAAACDGVRFAVRARRRGRGGPAAPAARPGVHRAAGPAQRRPRAAGRPGGRPQGRGRQPARASSPGRLHRRRRPTRPRTARRTCRRYALAGGRAAAAGRAAAREVVACELLAVHQATAAGAGPPGRVGAAVRGVAPGGRRPARGHRRPAVGPRPRGAARPARPGVAGRPGRVNRR